MLYIINVTVEKMSYVNKLSAQISIHAI